MMEAIFVLPQVPPGTPTPGPPGQIGIAPIFNMLSKDEASLEQPRPNRLQMSAIAPYNATKASRCDLLAPRADSRANVRLFHTNEIS
jgi:hypothetical protein